MNPIIAIVGEPNVGKSSLLNKIAGSQIAVTSPIPGTTRDRQYVDVSWNDKDFTLVDTAGITYHSGDELEQPLNAQVEVALKEADILWFVVDGKSSPSQVSRSILLKFRKSKTPVVLIVNKADSQKRKLEIEIEFQKLGIKPFFAVSATNGRGTGDLLDHTASILKKTESLTKPIGIAVSIVGKPNVGKSSLLNTILKDDRVVVSNIPGTTRSPIDTYTTINGQDYTFIDTAGLKRKKEHRQALPDLFSSFHTFKAIRRSDICLLLVDATEPLSKQDQAIAGEIINLHKGLIMVASKMDLYNGEESALRDRISGKLPFLWTYPLFFISSKTGEGIDQAIEAIKPIYEARLKEVSQDDLNRLLGNALKTNPPKLLRDQKKPKVFGLNQIATNPPLFELLVNHPAAISKQFRGHLTKKITKELNLWGTPISLKLRGKDKT